LSGRVLSGIVVEVWTAGPFGRPRYGKGKKIRELGGRLARGTRILGA